MLSVQITSLGFRSLTSIDFGNVYIGYMRGLCYEDTLNWTRILKNPKLGRINFDNGVLQRSNKICGESLYEFRNICCVID